MNVERKNGWRRMTESNVEECGLCDNIMMAGRMPIMVEFPPEKETKKKTRGPERFVVDVCDSCRRLVCTCDLCAGFKLEIVEVEEEDDEDKEEETGPEFYEGFRPA